MPPAPELRDELLTALLAGHETTAASLAWGLDCLGHAPAALAALPYLDAVDLRVRPLRPQAPRAARRMNGARLSPR